LSQLEPQSSQDHGLFVADFAQDQLKKEIAQAVVATMGWQLAESWQH